MTRAIIASLGSGRGHPSALLRAAFVFLLALTTLYGATSAQAQSFLFNRVVVEGNTRIETGTILSYAGITTGQPISAGELNASYQSVLGSGLFETVLYTPRGSTLTIAVQEFPTINRINIEGNARLKDEALLAVIQSAPRKVYSPSVAAQDAAAMVAAYEQAGRLAATVEPVIIKRSNNRVDLVFEVSEGRVIEVERISFVGNRAFSDRRLRRVLESKQAGLFRQIIQRDTFIGDRIQFDRQVLTDFYRSRGYVDFEILSVTSEFSRERNAFFVTFNVREGQQYRYGTISAASDLPEINVAQYQAAIRIKPGQIYNPMGVDNTIARLERLAVQQDLDFVRVEPRVDRDDRNRRLSITFMIVRGPRIFVERIDIEGNATTLDRVIRRQFTAVEGDPFNPREIREAASRIQALGFFSKADVNTREGSSPDQVIVDVDVEEQPTGSLGFGATYSAGAGFGFTGNFSERNFLGRGQALSFDVSLGSGTGNYSFSFREPAFLGRNVAYFLNLSYSTSNAAQGSTFNSTFGTARTGFDFPLNEFTRMGVNVFTQVSSVSAAAGSSPILLAEQARGEEWATGVGYTLTYRSIGTGLNPDAGVLLRWSQDIAGIAGVQSYVKTTALVVAETKVWNNEITLRAVGEAGAINTLNGMPTRITDRFSGNNKIRGFNAFGFGPRDTTTGDALGGNYMAVAKFEAEFPLGLPEEYGITGGVFADIGSVWGLDNVAGGQPPGCPAAGTCPVDDSLHLRSSVGVSLFWTTPIGPLRFNYAFPITQQPYDVIRQFDVTVRTTF